MICGLSVGCSMGVCVCVVVFNQTQGYVFDGREMLCVDLRDH